MLGLRAVGQLYLPRQFPKPIRAFPLGSLAEKQSLKE